MGITASEVETALVAFGGAFAGYLSATGLVINTASVEFASEAGAVAAFATLGYHVLCGNVSTATPAKPAA